MKIVTKLYDFFFRVPIHACRLYTSSVIPPHFWGKVKFPHPVGIVVCNRATFGRNVTVYQNVTIGVGKKGDVPAPSIGDDVVIYSGAVIVGGISIGEGAVIGANAVVTKDVPAGSLVYGYNEIAKKGEIAKKED